MRIEIPRRRRETITRLVSSAGTPTSSNAHDERLPRGRRLRGADHHERRDDEADRHAAAVAEEDPRRRGEVVRQEAEAGAAQRRRGDREPGVAVRRARATATPPTTTSAIVLAAPSMLSNRLKALTTPTTQTIVSARSTPPAEPEVPAEARVPEARCDDDLDGDAEPGRDVAPVVDRADDPEHRQAADERERAAPVRDGHDEQRDEEAGHDRGAAEVRRRPRVALVAGGLVEELEAVGDPDRQRGGAVDERQRRRRDRARGGPQAATAGPPGRARS